MKIISYNVNGIRSAISKGLINWMDNEAKPDIICFQEIKMDASLHDNLRGQFPDWECYFFSAQKKGYSGVGILSKKKPVTIEYGCQHELFDNEGRVLLADYGDFAVLNAYYPSGSVGDVRQTVKDQFLEYMNIFLPSILKKHPNLIHSGDFNICHTEIDIHNPKKQVGVSGFLPHERQWFTQALDFGFYDSFRLFNTEADNYTWWSYRAGAKTKNLGWRIDYQWISESLKDKIKSAAIHPDIVMSDHCPIELELNI